MNAFAAAGAGFLLAVLWFDLMFDVQVIGLPQRELPEEVLASIETAEARRKAIEAMYAEPGFFERTCRVERGGR